MEPAFSGFDFEHRFVWQYANSLRHSTLFVAEVDGASIGMAGLEIRQLSNGWRAGAVIDVVVAAAWRKRGVFRRVIGALESFARTARVSVLTSIVNAPGAAALERINGWSLLTRIPLLRRDSTAAFPRQSVSEDIAVAGIEPVGITRDDRYREWRFRNHPFYRYQRISVSGGVEAEVKAFGSPVRGDIVEVFGSVRNVGALDAAYRCAAESLARSGATDVITWGILPPFELELLKRLGWRSEQTQDRRFAVNPLTDEAHILSDVSRWRIQPADIEHY